MEVTTNKISAAAEILKKLAENKKGLTKHEIILLLKKEILAARDSGNSWTDISKALKGAGIEISSQHVKACCRTIPKKFNKKENTTETPVLSLQTEAAVANQTTVQQTEYL